MRLRATYTANVTRAKESVAAAVAALSLARETVHLALLLRVLALAYMAQTEQEALAAAARGIHADVAGGHVSARLNGVLAIARWRREGLHCRQLVLC